MKNTILSSPIAAAILLAYSDSHGTDAEMNAGYATRNLAFRAPGPVSRDEAVAIMRKAVPSGYNNFDDDLLALLPADAQVTIAREGSVCVYVKGNPLSIPLDKADAYGENADAHPQFKADEISYDASKDESRLWWD